ncbi:MAG: helix-turn-helix domain-containing protein [Synechococcales bacterium]|nr:helix-turn-helix domain-containing protein [Synechococcales bacterium]
MLTLTYEYKLMPTKDQIAEMDHILEVCSSVWNYALKERKDWIAARKCPINACSLRGGTSSKPPIDSVTRVKRSQWNS